MALSPECNVHLDVLMGRDERIDANDVFPRMLQSVSHGISTHNYPSSVSTITDSQLSTRRELEKKLNF